MAHDPQPSARDVALRAVLVRRAKASRSLRRNTNARGGPTRSSRVPMMATLIVLVLVGAVSAVVITAGQAKTTAASADLASPAPTNGDHPRPSPSRTPTSGYSGPLVAMTGARSLTRGELHAWTLANTDDSPNAQLAEKQDWLTIRCMADHGYLYDPTFDGAQGLELGKTWGLTAAQLHGYRTALWGENLNSSKPYDWRTAGCHGRAVHLTGQDDNH